MLWKMGCLPFCLQAIFSWFQKAIHFKEDFVDSSCFFVFLLAVDMDITLRTCLYEKYRSTMWPHTCSSVNVDCATMEEMTQFRLYWIQGKASKNLMIQLPSKTGQYKFFMWLLTWIKLFRGIKLLKINTDQSPYQAFILWWYYLSEIIFLFGGHLGTICGTAKGILSCYLY